MSSCARVRRHPVRVSLFSCAQMGLDPVRRWVVWKCASESLTIFPCVFFLFSSMMSVLFLNIPVILGWHYWHIQNHGIGPANWWKVRFLAAVKFGQHIFRQTPYTMTINDEMVRGLQPFVCQLVWNPTIYIHCNIMHGISAGLNDSTFVACPITILVPKTNAAQFSGHQHNECVYPLQSWPEMPVINH